MSVDQKTRPRIFLKTGNRSFETLSRAFETLGQAFECLRESQKFRRVFGNLGRVFVQLSCLFVLSHSPWLSQSAMVLYLSKILKRENVKNVPDPDAQ